MFDTDRSSSIFAAVLPPADVAASPAGPSRVPLERLGAQICELAGHLAAATCRFLVLLADFDARRGWASWEMNSCAAWLSWKCQLSCGTAREHVRVARAANARTREEREQGGDFAGRGQVTVYEPEDCEELIRQYLEQAPRRTGPVLIPIQV